ncbi:hypothetical protein DB88DRAFT_474277 [Papiliotrema laurentii]|uniref:Uncharacterized protein n=1 Tax=Papiliotrema laurentii TaxID=5418 RepID=A0AAD9FPJ2_PAPLA|nr:hypothetical protein DB88DRAFT_474277 [Papiliotrema laurentii]
MKVSYLLSSTVSLVTLVHASPARRSPLDSSAIEGLYGDRSKLVPDCDQLKQVDFAFDWIANAMCAMILVKGSRINEMMGTSVSAPDQPVTKAKFTFFNDAKQKIEQEVAAEDALGKDNCVNRRPNEKIPWWSAAYTYIIPTRDDVKSGHKDGKITPADPHYGLEIFFGAKGITEVPADATKFGKWPILAW